MDNPNPIYYRDLITPDNAINDLISQLTILIGKYDEMKGKVQADAAQVAQSLKVVTGATEQQREVIIESTEESEKLARQYGNISDAQRILYRELQANIKAKKDQQQIDKLIVQLNNSAEGSYNRLSAQYRLNKIRLNEMSEAERSATDAGRNLERETKAIYEQMNKLQLATGKAQLQVGHYERGLLSTIGVSGKFADALTDSTKRSELLHGTIGALQTPMGALIGVAGAGVAAFKLWKDSASETQVTSDGLRFAVAELESVWDRFQKSVATMDFTNIISGLAESATAGRELAQALDEVFERTNSVQLLKSALSVENAALEEAAKNTQLSYDERLEAANKFIANVKPLYEQETETAKRVRDAQLENLFALSNQRKFATEEERELAKQEFAANIQNYNLNEEMIKQANEYIALQDRKKDAISSMGQRGGTVYISLVKDLQRQIDATDESVKAYANFASQYRLTNDEQVKAYVDAEVAYNNSLAAMYNENKRFITLVNNIEAQRTKENERQQAERAKAFAARQQAEEKAIAEKAKAEKQAEEDRKKAEQEQIRATNALLQAELQSINLQIAITKDGTDEMLQLRLDSINKQREIEIEKNKQLDIKLRQDEAAINAKYDAQIFEETIDFRTKIALETLAIEQDLAASEFDLLDKNERQKTQFRLEQEKERLRKILELNRINGKELTEEQRKTIENTIKAIDKESDRMPYKNLYELLGISLDSDQQEALNEVISATVDNINAILDAWISEADAAVEAANRRVDAAKSALDAEIEARNKGYANNVIQAQKELELEKQQQQKSLAEKERAQKTQLALDTVMQASSLITASANLWKSLSPLGIVGIAAAIAGIATMFGSFAITKIKAAQVAGTESYGDGTVELLQGGSHASGHDIDMGTKADGTRRRAEGGEYFAIINKRNSRRYGSIIPDVINSFNDGTFAEKYQKANSEMSGLAIAMAGGTGTDVSALERDVDAIRRQGERSRFVDGSGNLVEVYKNLKQTIIKS